MRDAAPAQRALVALALSLAALALTPGAGLSAPARSDSQARLPSAVWGVEVTQSSARSLTAKRLAALRRARINALVAYPGRVKPRTLAALRTRAARAGVLVLVPKAKAKGVRRARAAGATIRVARVSGPKALLRLRPASRMLALAPLRPSPAAAKDSWRTAIQTARSSARLDLAVTPVGRNGPAALQAYLALLGEAAEESAPKPPPPPPPTAPPPPGGSGGVPVYTPGNPPRTPTIGELPKLASVTKDGITWTFASPAPVGQFITGDYYVVGPVTVTQISPAPANGRNGSVKNLPPVDDDTGFDSRTSSNRYKASLRSDPPVSLAPGDSLVSSISVDTVGATKRWLFDKATGSPVKSISILTSLAAPQPPDAFRPSYVGKNAPIYYSRNLKRALLPNLGAVASTPSLGDWESHFRRPWVDSLFFNFDNPIEYMPDYSREIARAVGIAGLLLSLNYSTAQKEPLLVYLTQYGIDLYGLVQRGHPGWGAHGGHGSGRKLPIVLAGTLLGDGAMQHPPGEYGEDEQTISGNGWTGASALYAGHYGSSGTGQYGPYEHLQPRDWPGSLGEDYRRCCTSSSWIGEALVAQLVPGVRAAWNHPAFFNYADRWMTEDDTAALAAIKAQRGDDYSSFKQRKAWDAFATNMWKAYRSSAAPLAYESVWPWTLEAP
jgi:hypothetical protein